MKTELEYCNWTFWEVIKRSNKWGVQRDCDTTPLVHKKGYGPYDFDERVTITLTRGGGRNWDAYLSSLQPQTQTRYPANSSGCICKPLVLY